VIDAGVAQTKKERRRNSATGDESQRGRFQEKGNMKNAIV